MLKISNIGEVWVVGVDPGKPEYLTLKAVKLVEGADYVAGFKQALQRLEVNALVAGDILLYQSCETSMKQRSVNIS